jgi:hypothetical protein
MRDRIERKIEEIRQKPEHVRVWYAWIGVLITMFFVVIIWIFTLQENLSRSAPADDMKKIQEKIPIAKPSEELKSLDEIFGEKNASERMKTEER